MSVYNSPVDHHIHHIWRRLCGGRTKRALISPVVSADAKNTWAFVSGRAWPPELCLGF